MKLRPGAAKWLMNLYPPLLFNRIILKKVSSNFRYAEILVKKSWLNRNLQGTIFGGTLYAAADPYPAIMYWQIMRQQEIKTEAWLKKAEVEYHKPAASDIKLIYKVDEKQISEAMESLFAEGKFSCWHEVEGTDKNNEVVITIKSLIVLKMRSSI